MLLLCYICRFFTDRLINFTVSLTDQDLRTVKGPISDVPFLKCATYGRLLRSQIVSLTCEHPRYARRRYLFVAANVAGFFHLSEVEVFASKLRTLFYLIAMFCSLYLYPGGTFSLKNIKKPPNYFEFVHPIHHCSLV